MSFSLKENESGDPGDVSGIAKDDNLTGIFIGAIAPTAHFGKKEFHTAEPFNIPQLAANDQPIHGRFGCEERQQPSLWRQGFRAIHAAFHVVILNNLLRFSLARCKNILAKLNGIGA